MPSLPVRVRVLLGAGVGLLAGLAVVGGAAVRLWSYRVGLGIGVGPAGALGLLPQVALWTVVGGVVGAALGVRPALLRRPLIGALVGGAVGSFLAVERPLTRPGLPTLDPGRSILLCAAGGALAGGMLAVLDAARRRSALRSVRKSHLP
jgi:hypothetical protein